MLRFRWLGHVRGTTDGSPASTVTSIILGSSWVQERTRQCCCQDLLGLETKTETLAIRSRDRDRDPEKNELECTRVSIPWSRDHNTGTRSTEKKLERHTEERFGEDGTYLGRNSVSSSQQTRMASECGPMRPSGSVAARGFLPPRGKGPRCRPTNRQHHPQRTESIKNKY